MTTYTLRAIFENIFWPAAAGNVFWSLCSGVLKPCPWDIAVYSQIVILVVFSIYLTLGWLRLKISIDNIPSIYWPFEFLHLLLFVLSSLSAQLRPDLLYYFLFSYFILMIVGHLLEVWNIPGGQEYPQLWLVVMHIIGLVILVVGHLLGFDDYSLPGSFVVTFLIWLKIGRFKISDVEEKLKSRD